jgi:hypothetical protein
MTDAAILDALHAIDAYLSLEIATKSHVPCHDEQGRFAACGVGGGNSAGGQKRRQAAARLRSQGPDRGIAPRSRAIQRRKRGRHRDSQRRFDRHVASGRAHPDSDSLHEGHATARRDLAHEIRTERHEHRADIHPERKRVAHEIRQERKTTLASQAKDRRTLARDQTKESAKLDRTQGREKAKLESKIEAHRATAKHPERHAEKYQERRDALTAEHHEARESLAVEHHDAKRDLHEEHRDARAYERDQHRDQIAEHRRDERSSRNDLHMDHRERVHELRTEQRQERADLHRQVGDRPERAPRAESTPGRPHVEFDADHDSAEVLSEASRAVGRTITAHEMAAIAGAGPGDKVNLGYKVFNNGAKVPRVRIQGDGWHSTVTLRPPKEGDFPTPAQCVLEYIEVDSGRQGRNIGTEAFGRLVEGAAKGGFQKIGLTAEKSSIHNGYYTWPRLGCDGELWGSHLRGAPPELAKAKRVSDLMMTETGRTWWKANGSRIEVAFDLQEGSLSRRVFGDYRATKRKPS